MSSKVTHVSAVFGAVFSLVISLNPSVVHAQVCEVEEIAKLLASDGAAQDGFGARIAISDLNGSKIAIIGAFFDDDHGENSGSAYIFRDDGDEGWIEVSKLTAADGEPRDYFGVSVAISGDTAIVGAFLDDDRGDDSGSAYIFHDVGRGNWIEVAKLTADDAGSWGAREYFGSSVAISGDTAIVGAPGAHIGVVDSGAVYVFGKVGGSWFQSAKISASDTDWGLQFGTSISLSGDRAIIGAVGGLGAGGENSGHAYIFVADDRGSWLEVAKLTASDGMAYDYFGQSVAIFDDTAIVGAMWDDDDGEKSGSAYIFSADDEGTWLEVTKLTASDGATRDGFGSSVTISTDVAIVGALGDDDNGSSSGSAYVFRNDGTWEEAAKFSASDSASGHIFGRVAILDDLVLVGAGGSDEFGARSGSVYVFHLDCNCPADFNNDGIANILDFLAFLNAYSVGDPSADFNEDGIVNILDFLAFLNAYNDGC